MFFSHKYRCVYMSPAKTGTSSMNRAFNLIGGKFLVWGQEVEEWKYREPFEKGIYIKTLKHRCHLPEELADYYVFASIREPYARQISRYLHVKRRSKTAPSQEEFETYTFEKKTPRRSCYDLLHLYDGYEPPKGCVPFKISRFIKMETISEDFHNLPFVTQTIPFPHKNKCEFPNVKLHFTNKMIKHLQEVWAEDFEVFGYSKFLDITLL